MEYDRRDNVFPFTVSILEGFYEVAAICTFQDHISNLETSAPQCVFVVVEHLLGYYPSGFSEVLGKYRLSH